MAENVTLSNLANLQNETTAVGNINANNAAITTAFTDCLSRAGTSPNTMGSSLDMNSNRIVNLAAPVGANDAARLTDIGGAAGQSAAATASAAAALVSQNAAAASATTAGTSSSAAAASATSASASATTASTAATQAVAAEGFAYTWLSATTSTDPGSGKLKFDNGTIGSVANIFISETDGNSNALAALIADWGASTSSNKSIITVYKGTSPGTVWADFYCTAAITDNGTWDTVTVTYKAGPGGFTNNDAVFIKAVLVGDKGATGSAGSGVTAGGPHILAVYTASSTISGGVSGIGTTGQILTAVSATDPAWSANPQLGASGTAGSVTMGNATSGTIQLQPVTGAISGTVSIPTGTDTLVNLAGSQALSGKTSYNKVAITAPATSATLTIVDGKTITLNNTLTFSGNDSTTVNTGSGITVSHALLTLDTTDRSSAVAETITQGVTQLIQNSSYVTVLADLGRHLYKANSASSVTYTIAANASVAYPIGSPITFINAGGASAGTASIAINSDTLRLVGTQSSVGTRTLAAGGMATALKTTATEWHISGVGLT